MPFKRISRSKSDFTKIIIGLSSPDTILERSYGEVLKPKPLITGPISRNVTDFSANAFSAPIKDYECYCGKYKRIRYKGIVCDRCGVEVTEKKGSPRTHGPYQTCCTCCTYLVLQITANKIGYLLGMSSKKLDSVIYYERFCVIQPGPAAEGITINGELKKYDTHDLITEEEYFDILDALGQENQMLDDHDPNKFIADMGAPAVHTMLSRINLDEMAAALRHQANTETSQQRKAKP